jgi:hypothetical protein
MEGAYAEMTISADGTKVTTKIVGIKGTACSKVQKHFDRLGKRTQDGPTPEFFQEQAHVQAKVTTRG